MVRLASLEKGVESPRQTPTAHRQRSTDRQIDRPTESRQTDRDRHGVCIVPVRIGPTEVDRGRQRIDSCQPTEARQGPDRGPTEGPTELDRARQTDSQGSIDIEGEAVRKGDRIRDS